ncbi:hypothetical protein A2716_04975 [candidate division WWE3 bacterium RIFCSPHIGHO2_01_FULL_40_23]|uniref:J domain-containing protein n=1 Tax=candidate division WWE3 bacterium RIFCSPLOWO2_01_FULL_41_18 TaxID=1802625 RepID=A0A1F4VEU7_UNCKA|nr:MAG: hypothetical protein A2716_04975 [candidate division WWE3 bacterium RIFCSPHIGHO2_01_FULL_40_23]OGC55223.1 MAG: hypothetical protein A3A78_04585 [candidate division WWE3 bacterium RIFCSPLOWO2_01_FULL_41_18]
MAQRDYYEILGISKNASGEEIKAAYKRLAKEHHPDVAKDKTAAEAKFKEINEAYQVLSDPQKRKMYDTYGTAQPGYGGFPGEGPFGGFGGQRAGQWGPFTYTYSTGGQGFEGFGEDFDPFDIFEQVFGFRGFGGSRRPRKGKNLDYEMTISFADSVRGREEEININGKRLKIKIPAGIRDGNELRFEGYGEEGPSGLPPGDLHITIRIYPHKVFQRHGDDIYVTKEVSFVQAILGDEVEIPVVDPLSGAGESVTRMRVPQGTQPGTEFRIKGKGMPRLRSTQRGDMFVRLFVIIPQKLSKEQKKLLEEYRKLL